MKKKKEIKKIYKGLEDYGKLTEFEASELERLKKDCDIKSFDHRIILHRGKKINKLKGSDWLSIHEVYYDKNHKVVAYVEEPAIILSEIWKDGTLEKAVKDLKEGLRLVETAFKKEVIKEEDLPKDEEENK